MGKIIKLTEAELISLVQKVISEHGDFEMMPLKQKNLSKIHRKLNDRTQGETSRFDDNDDALAAVAFRGQHPEGGKIGDEDKPKEKIEPFFVPDHIKREPIVKHKPKIKREPIVKHKPTVPDYAEDDTTNDEENSNANERGIPYPNNEVKPSFRDRYQSKMTDYIFGKKLMR